MAVTPEQVKAAFQASQGASTIADATQALGDNLAPLFNASGGGGESFAPVIFVQGSPAATWGPILHGRGRPVSVEMIDPSGDEFDGVVRNSPDLNSVTILLGFAIAGKALIF